MKQPVYFLLFLIVFILSGCSMQNRVASSFGKRKYMKGYYFNFSHGNDEVAAKTCPHERHYYALMKPVAGHLAPLQANLPVIAALLKTPVNTCRKLKKHSALLVVPPGKIQIPKEGLTQTQVSPTITHNTSDNTQENDNPFLRGLYFVFFAIAVTIAAALLVLLLASLASNSAPQAQSILFAVILIVIIGVIVLLVSLARRNRISDNLAAPLADFLIQLFFAVLSAAGH